MTPFMTPSMTPFMTPSMTPFMTPSMTPPNINMKDKECYKLVSEGACIKDIDSMLYKCPNACPDLHKDCPKWASMGACSRNKMLSICAKSCIKN
jgi:hypothetical protein